MLMLLSESCTSKKRFRLVLKIYSTQQFSHSKYNFCSKIHENRLFLQTTNLKIVQLLVHHELVTKRSLNMFYFQGSICRRQILTDQYLVILNCVLYWFFKQNNTPQKFVKSINNTCLNSLYSKHCMDKGLGKVPLTKPRFSKINI